MNDTISTLARKFKLEVLPGADDPTADSWTPVFGIQEFTPGKEDNLEDDSDYDSDGWTSQVRTAQSWSIESTVARKQALNGGSLKYDPGQEIIRAASDQFGVNGTVHVRWYNRNGGDEAYQGRAMAGFTDDGGSTTSLSTATITLTGTGPRERIANPAGTQAAAWTAETAYAVGDRVTVSGGTLEATVAGTSGTTEPVAPASIGGTVSDGTVTWERLA